MSVEISNESGRVVDETRIVSVARHVMGVLGVPPMTELSILIVDLSTMENLHVRWMELPGPTDVMAFPQDDVMSSGPGDRDHGVPDAMLGDVVLCPDFAETNAVEAGHSLDDELDLLTCHGILHLVGYDHEDPLEADEMFGRQGELLASWTAARAGSS